MKYIVRDIENKLQKAASSFPAVVLTGARQSGKSTVLRKIFPDFTYVTVDSLKNKQFAIEDPEGFLNEYKSPVIIDEIQETPELLSYIKNKIDSNRDLCGQYILTGSQQFSMMDGVKESLAGRAAILDLATFSMHETASYIKKNNWSEIVFKGSYPELFTKENIDKDLWYSSYIETVINKDIAFNLKESNLFAYQKFIVLVAARIGQEINFSDIGKELGLDAKTIQQWIYYLQRSQIVFFLQPFFKNLEKRIVKKAKLYFFDTALAAYLTSHQSAEQIKHGPMSGALFENLICSEFIKQSFCQSKTQQLYFYRDSNQNEIDLILETASSLKLIEIKSTETPSPDHCKKLIVKSGFFEKYNPELFLINSSDEERQIKGVKLINFKNISINL